MMVLHHLVDPDFPGLTTTDIHQLAADPVSRADVDVAIGVNRSRNHSGPAGPLRGPEDIPGSGIHPGQRFHEKLDVLPLALHLRHNHGGILRAVLEILALPDGLSGLLVEGHDGSLFTARGDDQLVSVNEGRFGVAPVGNFPAKVVDQAEGPFFLSLVGGEAGEIAVGIHGVDQAVINSGRPAGARAPTGIVALLGIGPDDGGPGFLTTAGVQADDLGFSFPAAGIVEAVSHHRRRAVALAAILEGPHQFGSSIGPLGEQSLVGGMAVTIRTPPAGPVVGQRATALGRRPGEGDVVRGETGEENADDLAIVPAHLDRVLGEFHELGREGPP